MNETARQLAHLVCIAFVLLALFVDKFVLAALFFAASFWFLIYSFSVRRRNILVRTFRRLEEWFRLLTNTFERDSAVPFMGAFWLYFSCGLAFFVFPAKAAMLSCSIAAVSDSFSTLAGLRGRHKLIGGKTVEGSLAFLASAFTISLFFAGPLMAAAVTIVATLSELLPNIAFLRRYNLDDNFTIPMITGLFACLLSV